MPKINFTSCSCELKWGIDERAYFHGVKQCEGIMTFAVFESGYWEPETKRVISKVLDYFGLDQSNMPK